MKRILSIVMLFAIIMSMTVFTGCGTCSHTNTETVNVVKATCEKVGYSGDTKCVDCQEIISLLVAITKTQANT